MKQQKMVLYCLEKICQFEKSIIPILPSILNGFWEEGVLDEVLLGKWCVSLIYKRWFLFPPPMPSLKNYLRKSNPKKISTQKRIEGQTSLSGDHPLTWKAVFFFFLQTLTSVCYAGIFILHILVLIFTKK